MMAFFPTSIVLALLVAAGSILIASNDPPPAMSTDEASVVNANNTFGLQMLRMLNNGRSDSNLFISPFSISMALAMTLNGATGPTRDSIEHTLALNGLTSDRINDANRSLPALLGGLDSSVTFSIANSIWYRERLPVRAEFITTSARYFDAAITELDFTRPDAAPRIDRWVSESTRGKIEQIAPNPIPGNLVMFLINAIYFKGTWTSRFDSSSTRDATFRTGDSGTVPVKMMYQKSSKLRQYEDNRMQMLELPCGNGTFSMVIAMPHGDQTLDAMISTLDAPTWTTWMNRLHEDKGEIYLPRFSITWQGLLGETLRKMGMAIAFSETADFSGISSDIYISEVRHKTFVEVNEQGAEAAAVTSVEMARRISKTSLPGFVMRVDRPFLFAIRDSHTGSILFVGKVIRPS